jgi:beta-lactamase regulating signal transducer with metallopeptidase domain
MTLFILVLQITLWLLLGTLLYLATLRLGPRLAARCLALILGGLLLLTLLALLPLPGWPLAQKLTVAHVAPKAVPETTNRTTDQTARVEISSAGTPWRFSLPTLPVRETAEVEPAPTLPAFSWEQVGLALLLACGFFGLGRLLLGLWAVRECRRRSVPITEPSLLQLADHLRQEMQITQAVELRVMPGLGSPATVGWRQPVLLLPENWSTWSQEECRSVLAHELAHVQAGDYPTWLLAQLGAVLHGYQPLVYWLLARLHREQELAADLVAARHAGGATVYLRSLCRLALAQEQLPQPFPARTLLSGRFSLIRRITMLRSRKNEAGHLSSRWRWCSLALLLLLGIAVAGVRSPGWAQEKMESYSVPLGSGHPAQPKFIPAPFVLDYLPANAMGAVGLRPALAMQHIDNPAIRDKANKSFQEFCQRLTDKKGPALRLDSIEQVVFEYGYALATAHMPSHERINLNLTGCGRTRAHGSRG